MSERAIIEVGKWGGIALLWAACGGAPVREAPVPEATATQPAVKAPVSVGATQPDPEGALFAFETQEGSPLRQPAPGTDDLSTPDARTLLLDTRTPGGRIAAAFSDTQTVLYGMLNVPIFCASTDVCARRLGSPFPDFYRPTYREYFNAIARSTGTHWEYTADWRDGFQLTVRMASGDDVVSMQRDGFVFSEPPMPLPFAVEVVAGWRAENRGDYVSFIPPGRAAGLDIYMGGEYSADGPGLFEKVRDHWAMLFAAKFKADVTPEKMTAATIADADALFWEYRHPEPDKIFRWRQWAFIKSGHCFVIVSVIDDADEDLLWPQVSAMVASFRMNDTH